MPAELRQIYPLRVFSFADSEPSLTATANSTGAALSVQNANDAASNQVAVFQGANRATAADGDNGYITYTLEDSGGTQSEFARMTWMANDVTSNTKDSKVVWAVQSGNTLTDVWEISSSTSGEVTTSFSGGDIVLPDNVSIQLGNNGADADISSNGSDIKWIVPSNRDVMLGRTGAPSPNSILHLWEASAGSVSAANNTLLTLEDSGTALISILAPTQGGILFGDAADNNVGQITYTHSNDSLGITVGAASQLVWTDGIMAFQRAMTLSSTAAFTLNATGISGTAIKDEDNMASDSATHLASQQSIKAYVDTVAAAQDTLPELDDVTISSVADNNFLQYNGSVWENRTYVDFAKIAAPSDPSTEEGRLYLKEVNAANNALAVKLQKGTNIVEVELTSPGAICAECGRDDGAKDPTYDFQRGVMIVSLWCGHVYEMELPEWRRVA
tara:strand:+ start:2186 stop:3517 length:1332 start_codon:yes stop_codon:yes gene_type:complete